MVQGNPGGEQEQGLNRGDPRYTTHRLVDRHLVEEQLARTGLYRPKPHPVRVLERRTCPSIVGRTLASSTRSVKQEPPRTSYERTSENSPSTHSGEQGQGAAAVGQSGSSTLGLRRLRLRRAPPPM